jgi:tripartite-type tricarboxylate transporter receptor subunit TctC
MFATTEEEVAPMSHRNPFHRIAVLVAVPVLLAVAGSTMAQTWPVRPIRVVVPWPPGGSNDIAARIIAPRVAELLGQPLVIDNRPGAAGTIGAEAVARSDPDGHTLMVHSVTHLANATLYGKLPYDTLKDFVPVATISNQPTVLVVHPTLPVQSVKELIALARKRPKQVFYASAGNGSAPHLSAAQLEALAKIDMEHVPFKGGAPAVIALVAGEVQMMIATLPTVVGQIKAGRVRALGVASAKRSALLPEVPSIAETVPGYDLTPWIAVFAPTGTPKDIVARVHAAVTKVIGLPEIREQLANNGLEPFATSQEEFAKLVQFDHDRYAALIRRIGAKIE